MHLLPLASTVAMSVLPTGATPVPPTGVTPVLPTGATPVLPTLITKGIYSNVIIKLSSAVDEIIRKLKQVLVANHVALHDIFQESIGSISNELLQVDIITRDVFKSPSYDAIIGQFEAGMDIARTWRDLNEHCKKFITALTNVGGPVKDAALMIQQEWITRELSIGATQVLPSTEVLLITKGIYSESDNKS